MLIERHGARASWTAIGSRFRCRECDHRPMLELRCRANVRPPLASWEVHAMASRQVLGLLDGGTTPRSGGLPDILPEAAVLVGFAVLFFSVGVLRFRYE
jgi:hypothetical protein